MIAQLRIYKKDAGFEKHYAKRKIENRDREEVAIEERINEENLMVIHQCSASIVLRCIVICAPDHALPDFFKVILT